MFKTSSLPQVQVSPHLLDYRVRCVCVCVCPQVSLVLSALQTGNKGTQACITAASAVSGIIADLDTTIMFATAGTLNAENDESFADHRSELETSHILSVFKLPLCETSVKSPSARRDWRLRFVLWCVFDLKRTRRALKMEEVSHLFVLLLD